MKALILHGWGGSDFPHWQSYLAGELAKDYGTVCFPLLKDKDAPKKDVWMQQVKEILQDFKPDTVICHSLANTLWFHLCHEAEMQKIKNLFLVAPPSLTCELEELSSFFPVGIPKELYAKSVVLITSTDDPYIDEEEAGLLAKSLNATHMTLKNAGHINASSGYGEWREIVELVKGADEV
ncbi:alpha/beta hydrolase [Sulfurimonas sp. HSL-1716]|uniref:RBBP9/YdeN family alpha/beta hydrolase n=1 Tax=Hydrocurvibacter sulfurireducens TaxID=3131937 RepID=UPI0031F74556